MFNNTNEHYEVEYFDKEDYEAARRRDSAGIHQTTIQKMEARYGCTYPEFILQACSPQDKAALRQWSFAIRYLARYEETLYA